MLRPPLIYPAEENEITLQEWNRQLKESGLLLPGPTIAQRKRPSMARSSPNAPTANAPRTSPSYQSFTELERIGSDLGGPAKMRYPDAFALLTQQIDK
jgi:hypothetical protein